MRPLLLVAAIVLAGCGGGTQRSARTTTGATTTAPPPTTTAPTTTVRSTTVGDEHLLGDFEYLENGLCALTDERTRPGQPAGYVALCIMREEEGVPFITCSVFSGLGDRSGKELEFHGFPGAQKLPDPKNWTVPSCEPAAHKAAAWLVRHLAAS